MASIYLSRFVRKEEEEQIKTQQEIEKYLEEVIVEWRNCKKMKRRYLETVASGIINALNWVLEKEPFDFNSEDGND